MTVFQSMETALLHNLVPMKPQFPFASVSLETAAPTPADSSSEAKTRSGTDTDEILQLRSEVFFLQKKLERIIEEQDSKVWLQAWCVVAGTEGCHEMVTPAQWADHCLKEFKSRFQ